MSDIYKNQPCSELLQDLTMLVRRHIASAREMQLDILAGLHAQLRDAHRMAIRLEARARDAEQMEEVARDIEMVMVPEALDRTVVLPEPLARLVAHHERARGGADDEPAVLGVPPAELIAEQRALQAGLDAVDAAKVVRLRPRLRRVPLSTCGNDDDGDAA